MGRIYDTNGNVMNLAGILDEILEVATDSQLQALASSIAKYDMANSHAKLAHGILDAYSSIDGVSEQGTRLRKLLDKVMTKYQKSPTTSADDQSRYHFFITQLSK